MRTTKDRKTAKYNYFLSYTIIVLVLVCISTISCFSAARMMKETALMENRGYLKSIKYDTDEIFRNAKRAAVTVAVDENMRDFCKVSINESEENTLLLYNAVKNFALHSGNIPENTFFYSGKSGIILTMNGAEEYREYIESAYERESAENILRLLSINKLFTLCFAQTVEGNREILYIYDIKMGNFDNRMGKVIVPIRAKSLENSVLAIGNVYSGATCYFDGESFAVNPGESDIYQIDYPEVKENFLVKENEKRIVTAIKSDVVDGGYVASVDKNILFKNAQNMMVIIYMNIFLMLLLGAVASVFLVKRDMKPLRKLISVLEGMGIKADNVQNEFDFIQNVVSATVKEKEEIGQIVDRQNKTLKTTFIQGLIRGRYDGKFSINDMFKNFDIKPISNKFAVGVFYVKNPDSLFGDEKGLDIEEKQRLTSLIMGNILEELIGARHRAYVVEIRDMQVCLVNVNKDRTDCFYEDMEEAIEDARENIKKYFSIDFTATFGNVYSSVRYIPNSYDEAMQTMNYKTIVGMDGIFKFSDISEYDDESHSFSRESEKEFLNAIKCGNQEKALSLFSEIVDINIQTKKLPEQELAALMINITATILKALDMVREENRQKYLSEITGILQMIGNAKIEDYKKMTGQVVLLLCSEMARDIKNKNGSLGEKAVNFIKENYSDSGINASAVAENLGVHAAYLSKIFREQVGMGVLECINETRMEKAKEIISSENLSIEEVAALVGISNERTFARLFKKHEGMTPGEYRSATK